MLKPVRVRFAPSPTGPLHIGGVRTALYNYLFARKHQGRFLLRIEDTDQTRFVPGAEAYLWEVLQWLGIETDESPVQGGPFGPYKQSERKAIYQTYITRLVAEGKAYYAFDTPEELEAMRQRLQAAGVVSPHYNAISRVWMKNSLTLPQEEVLSRLQQGAAYVIRINIPQKETFKFYDLVRGWVCVQAATLDDKVLMKSDGMPTYHFANVVDDYLMQITHVIRGEEWLPSTPLHFLLYTYLGWDHAMPEFVHLPLLLSPEGKGKLSKRDTEKYGFPIVPITWPVAGGAMPGFREQGYLPEALLNFLALLGWSPGKDQEIFSKEALIQAFSLERIGKSSIQFAIQKAKWFNQYYLKKQSEAIQVGYLRKALVEQGLVCTAEKAVAVCRLIKERVVFPGDFWEQGQYFFKAPVVYDVQLVQAKGTPVVYEVLAEWAAMLPMLTDLPVLKSTLLDLMARQGVQPGHVMPVLRVALTGVGTGPDLLSCILLIGQEESSRRIRAFLKQYANG